MVATTNNFLSDALNLPTSLSIRCKKNLVMVVAIKNCHLFSKDQIDLKTAFFLVSENITRTRMAQDLGLISRRGIERLLRGEGSALTTLDGGRYAHQPGYF